MIIRLRQGFRLNTNLFETNILNLAVVLGVVIKVVGGSLQSLLDQRRQTILLTFQEAELKAEEAAQRLEEAQRALEAARVRGKEIRLQAVQTVEREKIIIQEQLERDLRRLQERGNQAIQLERQRITQAISRQISNLAVTSAENTLLKVLKVQTPPSAKQKELNEMYIRETFCHLSELNHLKAISNIEVYR